MKHPIREIKTWLACIFSISIAFCIAWPSAFKLGWTYSDWISGKQASPNDSFLMLFLVLSIVFSTIGAVYCAILRQGDSRKKAYLTTLE
ncbi:hypothetical protein [Alteromonas gracilis]|uniref:hypothetical protein n=1 Tax=Alteromonas gracilis TaxID=1479524 RepID=UPI0037370945